MPYELGYKQSNKLDKADKSNYKPAIPYSKANIKTVEYSPLKQPKKVKDIEVESFLDGIEVFDRKLNAIRQKEKDEKEALDSLLNASKEQKSKNFLDGI